MAQTCRQPGLSSVFTDLLSYAGDEIYVEKIPGLEGRTMAEINMYFSKSTVIGLVKNGLPMINPAMDTVVEQEDKLILIAEDDGVVWIHDSRHKCLLIRIQTHTIKVHIKITHNSRLLFQASAFHPC